MGGKGGYDASGKGGDMSMGGQGMKTGQGQDMRGGQDNEAQEQLVKDLKAILMEKVTECAAGDTFWCTSNYDCKGKKRCFENAKEYFMTEDDRCNFYKGGCECKDYVAPKEDDSADKEYNSRNCDANPDVMWAQGDSDQASIDVEDNSDDGKTDALKKVQEDAAKTLKEAKDECAKSERHWCMNNYDCYGKEQCFQAETKTFFEFEEDFCEMMDGGCYCKENIIEKNCDLSPHVIQAGDQLAYAND